MTFDQLLQSGVLFGFIAALRKQWPSIDGKRVWFAVFVAGLALSGLVPDAATVGWRTVVLRGLLASAGALGMDGALSRVMAARKTGPMDVVLVPELVPEPELVKPAVVPAPPAVVVVEALPK